MQLANLGAVHKLRKALLDRYKPLLPQMRHPLISLYNYVRLAKPLISLDGVKKHDFVGI